MIEEVRNPSKAEPVIELTIDNMYNANWHFGELESNTHPSMRDYVLRYIKSYGVIDIAQAKALFKEALHFIEKVIASGGKILITGQDLKIEELIKEAGEKVNQFYITRKWPGGLLTNWHNTFSKSMSSIKEKDILLSEQTLTKREQMKLAKQLSKAKDRFAGVIDMKGQLPAAVIVLSGKDQKPIQECKKSNIPIIVLADTSSNVVGIQYIVPGNSPSVSTVQLFLYFVMQACKNGMEEYEKHIATRKILDNRPRNFRPSDIEHNIKHEEPRKHQKPYNKNNQ